jgi:hypothetical protein
MLGFGKKLILVIFATSLLAGNASAVEPKLSGSYNFLQVILPPSDAIAVAQLSQLKITPNKTGRAGKIEVIAGDGDADGVDTSFTKGDVLNYRTTAKKLFMSGFSCRGGRLDPTGIAGSLGFQEETPADCGKERSFDITYVNSGNGKIARHAFVSRLLEVKKNGLNPMALGSAVVDPYKTTSSLDNTVTNNSGQMVSLGTLFKMQNEQ